MSVYIELVIFNNFFLDAMLLVATATIRRRKSGVLKVIICSVIGCACATVYAIAPTWAKIVIRILLAPLLCALIIKPQGKNAWYKIGDFIGTILIFVILTFLTGGIIYGLSYMLGIDLNSYAILGLIAMAVCALLILARLVAHKKSTSANSTCQTTICVGNERISANALCDSGNLLVDEVSGLPVVILSQKVENKLNISDYNGFINVNTVSGEDSLALVRLDEVKVGEKHFKALGALSHKNFDNFDIILQNSMF